MLKLSKFHEVFACVASLDLKLTDHDGQFHIAGSYMEKGQLRLRQKLMQVVKVVLASPGFLKGSLLGGSSHLVSG